MSATQLNDPDLQRRINALRETDNWTNWIYLAREYLILALILGPALSFYHFAPIWGISWLWFIPVTLVAILLVGLAQHRLVMLAHEAGHYILFRNRLLNELVSNWFCLYPLLSTTYNYRLQHLAHHQFTNDPERDPDLYYMKVSGHRFRYPMPIGKFWWDCVFRLLFWIPGLIHYILLRAKVASVGVGTGPYSATTQQSKLVNLVHAGYLLGLIATLSAAVWWGNVWLMGAVPAGMLMFMLVFSSLTPESCYLQTVVKPDLPQRWTMFLRMMHLTLLLTGLAWLTFWTREPWPLYYFVLWLAPLGSTFSFFMILREEIQHSNTGQEPFNNTRDFHGNPLVCWALFPLNMNYHLEHHLYPMIPHYQLPRLQKMLLEQDVFRDNITIVEGYLLHRSSSQLEAAKV